MYLEDPGAKTPVSERDVIFLSQKRDLYKNWRDRLPYIPSGFNENHFVQTTVDC